MDNGIKKSNMVAGSCDQYTKASEIKELSKFLGALKKKQDDNTKLEEQNLGVKGFGDDAVMKDVESLSNNFESLSPNRTEISVEEKLNTETAETIVNGIKSTKLSDTVEKIIDVSQTEINLPNHVEQPITENTRKSRNNLSTEVEQLIGETKKIELPSTVEILNDTNKKDSELSSHRENIEVSNISTLDEEVKAISGEVKKSQSLTDTKEVRAINQNSEIKDLNTSKENLNGEIKPDTLIDHIENISNNSQDSSIELSSTSEIIEGEQKEVKLSSTKTPLGNSEIEEISALSEIEENIIGDLIDNSKLENDKIALSGNLPTPSLSNKLESLKITNKETNLETHKESLEVKENIQLKQEAEKLEDVRKVQKLSNTIKPIQNTEEPNIELETSIENVGEGIKQVSLVEHSESIEGTPKNVQLNETSKIISGTIKDPVLSTSKEGIGKNTNSNNVNKLETDTITIQGSSPSVTLDEALENVVGNIKSDQLETDIVSLTNLDKKVDLERKTKTIVGDDNKINKLESSKINRLGEDNRVELSQTLKTISEQNKVKSLLDEKTLFKLDEKKVKLYDKEIKFSPTDIKSLEKTVEHKAVSETKDVNKLSDSLINGPTQLKVDLETKKGIIEEDNHNSETLGKSELESNTEVVINSGKKTNVSDKFQKEKVSREYDHPDLAQNRKEFSSETGLYENVLGREYDHPESTPTNSHSELNLAGKEDIRQVNSDVIRNNNLSSETEIANTTDSFNKSDKTEKALSNQHDDFEDKVYDLVRQFKTTGNTEAYYNFLLHFADSKDNKGFGSKISGLVSAFLGNGSNLSEQRVKQFERLLFETSENYYNALQTRNESASQPEVDLNNKKYSINRDDSALNSSEELENVLVERAHMKLPKFTTDTSISSYLRFTAEEALRKKHGKIREVLLDEALGVLIAVRSIAEKKTHSSPSQLPGKGSILDVNLSINSGVNKLKKSIKASVATAFDGKDFSQPSNYPEKETLGWEALNQIGAATHENPYKKKVKDKSFWSKLGSTLSNLGKSLLGKSLGEKNYSFKEHYLSGQAGMDITLGDLAGGSATVRSVNELFHALSTHANITTAQNFTSTKLGDRVTTLDSNAYWEIVLAPYVGVLNNNISFLPPITEINYWNIINHKYNTGYTSYIPITGFEMQKSKLTNKTAPLFDGEISFPTSVEYTNEFRISIADDQFKSWRNYFERCAEVAVYSSKPHKAEDYKGNYTGITVVDRNFQIASPYKNISFLCSVYSMTPQYSTINKYNLLLVMKDFAEERTGETDAGGGDLSVTFSIVGENPPEKLDVRQSELDLYSDPGVIGSGARAGSIISNAISTGMGLIK